MKTTIKFTQSPAIALIDKERRRQQIEEGYTIQSDMACHRDGELAMAAAYYALPSDVASRVKIWPWSQEWYKPTPNDRKREIIKAGALLVSEWDRLDAVEQLNKENK
jgi:hypothetical protein